MLCAGDTAVNEKDCLPGACIAMGMAGSRYGGGGC